MTGEMSQSEVTREAWPIHFAIADALGGEVRAFDQYQGPYVFVPRQGRFRARKLWLNWVANGFARIYDEMSDRWSTAFPYCEDWAPRHAAELVERIHHWHKVPRQT